MSLVRKNIFILFFIQGTNYIFPLLTIPYLSRIFGPEGIGALSLAQAIILYLVMVIDFGFNLTVTRRVSIAYCEKNQQKIDELYTHTIFIKFIIFLISLFIVGILCQIVPKMLEIKSLIYIGFISLLGVVVNPIWLFQGLQRMTVLLIPTTISKIITLILIYIFIKDKSDLNYAMFFTSLSLFLSGIISLYYVKKFKLAYFTKIEYMKTLELLSESFYVFLSYLGSSVYTTMNTFIMSFFVSFKQIGIYSAADKVTQTAQSLMGPIHQAIFPNLSSFNSKEEYLRKFKNFGYLLVAMGLFISTIIFTFSNKIILLLFGYQFLESSKVLEILAFLPIIISFGILFGQWGLIVIGEAKVLGKIYIYAGVFHLLHIFILLKFFGIYGGAVSIVITESIVSMLLGIVFFKKLNKLNITSQENK